MGGINVKHLMAVTSAIARGEYDRGKDLMDSLNHMAIQKDEADFLESLGIMSVKLEGREYALENTIQDLTLKNAELVEARRKSQLFSILFVSLFLSVSLFVFLMSLAKRLDIYLDYSPRIVEAIFLIECLFIIRKSGLPLSSLGLTLKGAWKSIGVILPGTLACCAALVVLKALCILWEVPGVTKELFIADKFDLLLAIYLPVAILQEFLAKGVIQTAIHSVLNERNATFWAIITSAALFGLVHIELSATITLVSFILSIYWGYAYSKQRCLAGVSLSHFLIGGFANVLGFWDYLFVF